MPNPVVRHSRVTGSPSNPNVLVDGPAWDDEHVVVGLENVDNTSDANKPVSIAQAAAIALKADAAAFSNIDNTSDANKPVSTAQAAAIALKANSADFSNVDNTSDLNKPVSTAQAAAIALKADASIIATGSTTSRPITDRFSDVINIKDFGASSSNTAAANTTATQSAINAMPSFRGVLYIPGGYYLTNPLTVSGKNNFTIRGEGRETSVLVLASAGKLLRISDSNFSSVFGVGFTLNGTPQGIAGTQGLVVDTGTGNLTVKACNFSGFADEGMYQQGTSLVQMSGIKVIECYFLGNGGKQLHLYYSNDYHILNNQFGSLGSYSATAGSYLDNSSAGLYQGNLHWENVRGYQQESCNYNTVSDNRFELSDQENVYINGGYKTVFDANKVFSGSLSGNGLYDNVYVKDTTSFQCTGNSVFTWDSTYTSYGINFDGTNSQLTIGKNQVDGYDATNRGPYRVAGTTASASVRPSADLFLAGCTAATIPANSTSYLGSNGAQASDFLTFWVTGTRYCVLFFDALTTSAPGVGQTYSYTFRSAGSDTAMTSTSSGSGQFEAIGYGPTKSVVLSGSSDFCTIKLVTSATAAAAAHRYIAVLAEY